MDAKKLLQKIKARLEVESWIQAALCGAIVGLALNILCSMAFWFVGIKMFWISIVAFLVGAAVSAPLFYYKKFRKSNSQVAARVDMLGLEERVLTMTQLENDDSYMARRQREDTISALKSVNESLIKISVSVSLVIVCAVALVMGAGLTTVSAVADQSLLDMLKKTEEQAAEADVPTFKLEYQLKKGAGGRIDGPKEQEVKGGKDGAPVQAVADDGYIFVGWSDGYEEDYRVDIDVNEDISVFAIFVYADFGDEYLRQEGDKSDDDNNNNNNNNNYDENPDDFRPPEDNPEKKPGNSNGSDMPGGGEVGSGNTTAPNNQIFDGSTYYGNEMSGATSDAQDAMNNMGGGENSDVITDYFQGITK